MNTRKTDRWVLLLCVGLFVGIMTVSVIAGERSEEKMPLNEAVKPAAVSTPQPVSVQEKAAAYSWPAEGEILRHFSAQPEYDAARKMWTSHVEIDLQTEGNRKVCAAMAGQVTDVLQERGMWTVYILQTDGITARYAGLEKSTCAIERDQRIRQGETLGETDEKGMLHFALKKQCEWIDPENMLK